MFEKGLKYVKKCLRSVGNGSKMWGNDLVI